LSIINSVSLDNIYDLAKQICVDHKLDSTLLNHMDSLQDAEESQKLLRKIICDSYQSEDILKIIKDNAVFIKVFKRVLSKVDLFFISNDHSYLAQVFYEHQLNYFNLADLLTLSKNKEFVYSVLDRQYAGELKIFMHQYRSITDFRRAMNIEEIISSIEQSMNAKALPKKLHYMLTIAIAVKQPTLQSKNGLTNKELVEECDPHRLYEEFFFDEKNAGALLKQLIDNQYTKQGRRPHKS
jgi:hypothetical protein